MIDLIRFLPKIIQEYIFGRHESQYVEDCCYHKENYRIVYYKGKYYPQYIKNNRWKSYYASLCFTGELVVRAYSDKNSADIFLKGEIEKNKVNNSSARVIGYFT